MKRFYLGLVTSIRRRVREYRCGPDHEWSPALHRGNPARRCVGCERIEHMPDTDFYAQFGEHHLATLNHLIGGVR